MTQAKSNEALLEKPSLEVGETDFAPQVLNSDLPVLVDFWAQWCGPCRMISPIVDAIAAQYAGKLKVVKVNVDEAARLCADYHIRSIPTLLLFRNGAVVERIVGAVSRTVLLDKLNAHLWPHPQST